MADTLLFDMYEMNATPGPSSGNGYHLNLLGETEVSHGYRVNYLRLVQSEYSCRKCVHSHSGM
jgi:hypothetical protein